MNISGGLTFDKKGFAGANAGLSSKDRMNGGLSASGNLGFSYSRDNGFNLGFTFKGAYSPWSNRADRLGNMGFGVNSSTNFSWDKGGKYKGSGVEFSYNATFNRARAAAIKAAEENNVDLGRYDLSDPDEVKRLNRDAKARENSREAGAHAGAGALAAMGIPELRERNSRNLEEEIAVGAEPENVYILPMRN